MKDFVNRFLEWFSRDTFVADLCGNEFARGVIVGAVLAALILLVIQLFLLIFFRRKAVSNIKVKSDFGTVEINASAVTNVIKAAAKSIESLEISKIRIYERGSDLDIVLRAVKVFILYKKLFVKLFTGTESDLLDVDILVRNET